MNTEKLESIGTYRGIIRGTSLAVNEKSGYPQAILQLEATEKFITDASELEHFGLTEPAWQAWDFNQGITAFLVLYKSGEQFSPDTELFHVGNLAEALGWEKGDFEAFANGSFIDKPIQFRVDLNEYNGKTSFKVQSVAHIDANPDRTLRPVSDDTLKALKAKVRGYAKKSAAVSAPAKASPASAPAVTFTATQKSVIAAASAPIKSGPPKGRGRPPKIQPVAPALNPLCTRDEAWEQAKPHQGKITDDEFTDQFIINSEEVGGSKTEDEMTPSDWGQVRDKLIDSLGRANVIA